MAIGTLAVALTELDSEAVKEQERNMRISGFDSRLGRTSGLPWLHVLTLAAAMVLFGIIVPGCRSTIPSNDGPQDEGNDASTQAAPDGGGEESDDDDPVDPREFVGDSRVEVAATGTDASERATSSVATETTIATAAEMTETDAEASGLPSRGEQASALLSGLADPAPNGETVDDRDSLAMSLLGQLEDDAGGTPDRESRESAMNTLLANLNASAREPRARPPAGEVLRGGGEPAPDPAKTPGAEKTPDPQKTPGPAKASDPAKAADPAKAVAPGSEAKVAGEPLPAAKPLATQEEDTKTPVKEGFVRAGSYSFHMELFHKERNEIFAYLRETFPDWLEKGHIYQVRNNDRAVIIFCEKPITEDVLGQQIVDEIERFDRLGLEIIRQVIRTKYIETEHLMKALVMAGLTNIYELTDEQDVVTWKEGNKNRSATRKIQSYKQTGMVAGGVAPIGVPEAIPYVYELSKSDAFEIPKQYSGENQNDKILVSFDKTSSTEERGGMMVVGTEEDIARIQAFTDGLDKPARQIMIEVQVIELDANKLSDFGVDSLQFGQGHHIGTIALPLPGESIVQPGLGPDVRADPEQFVPPVAFEGFDFAFDDTSVDLSGRFLSRLHFLVREGDAKIKARPKILTLDDRTSVLHLGREEPTFQSTGVTRDTNNGNLVNEVNRVTTQYVGFTLNIRPRITGGAEDEVALQIEIIVNELDKRTRVFEEDLAGIPSIIKRHYIGMNRVKNHRPMILGGLIQEMEVNNVNKIPLLGDIPLLGYLFRRTQKSSTRNEIILVVTPHILSEKGVDRIGTPKDSIHFDTFDSVLFNDRHILKGGDVVGVDPINKVPASGPDGRIFTPEEVVDLTLLNIVKRRELVSKLDVFTNYLGAESERLNWFQRKWPERGVSGWDPEDQEVYFRAAAILIENLKELNEDLTFDDIVLPRREILIPSSPYRISLTFDKVKALQTLGTENILRGERVEINSELVDLLKTGSASNMKNFADFIESKKREATDHGDMLDELEKLYSSLNPRKSLKKLAYDDVYRELDKANINFMTMATFFQTNLDEKYALQGAPDIGFFAVDFHAFTLASLSLKQRAQRLLELNTRWNTLNVEDDEDEEDGI